MRKLWCFNKKDVQLMHLADHLQKGLGLKLRLGKDGELHGVLFGNHFDAGVKEKQNANGGKYWCNEDLEDGEHTCVTLILHEKTTRSFGTSPDSVISMPVIKTPHPQLHTLHHKIPEHIDAFAKTIGATTCHHDAEKLKAHLDFFVGIR